MVTDGHRTKALYDTIIIGAGIGGISAGIYAARQRLKYLVLFKEVGGQMYESGEILNYPGIVKTVGAKFLETFSKQIEFNKLKIKEEEVVSVRRLKNGYWGVKTDKADYETQTIIIASGSEPRKLNVPGEKRLAKKGVTYCAVCDGPLFKNKNVAIIGGGNSALEAADLMSRIARQVYLLTKNPQLMGHAYLVQKVKKLRKVAVITNAVTKEILGNAFVSGLAYEQKGQGKKLKVQGIIVEIGRVPNINFVKNLVDRDEHQHIMVDRWARCLVKGKPDDTIYAVGDCSDVHEYQYAISAGMGVTALLKAVRYLTREKQA